MDWHTDIKKHATDLINGDLTALEKLGASLGNTHERRAINISDHFAKLVYTCKILESFYLERTKAFEEAARQAWGEFCRKVILELYDFFVEFSDAMISVNSIVPDNMRKGIGERILKNST